MPIFETIRDLVRQEKTFSVVTIISGPEGVGRKVIVDLEGRANGRLQPEDIAEAVVAHALELLSSGASDTRSYKSSAGIYEVFLDSYVPPPKIVIIGAVQIAQSLSRLAKELGYRVIVTDARAAFATEERFPEADQVLKGWPQDVLPTIRFDDSTYVVLLSHDPKFDEPTLHHVLPTSAPYVGAIGSRRTQEQRRDRLKTDGYDEEALSKLYGPIGLQLGGRSAEETALAILAEITAVRYHKSGGMLSRVGE